jgi:hypothetical protein
MGWAGLWIEAMCLDFGVGIYQNNMNPFNQGDKMITELWDYYKLKTSLINSTLNK